MSLSASLFLLIPTFTAFNPSNLSTTLASCRFIPPHWLRLHSRSNRRILPPVPASPSLEFQRTLFSFLRDVLVPKSSPNHCQESALVQQNGIGLKKHAPCWDPSFRNIAKGRWFGREVLEVLSTEFKAKSPEFYRHALESGFASVNGKAANPSTILRNSDIIEMINHRHEPPVTSSPVQILHHDIERQFIIVNKPGSIPVHPSGGYFHNSLIEILKRDFGFKQLCTVSRLDRLTSGIVPIPLTGKLAATLTEEFSEGLVEKEYLAKCVGEFSQGKTVCEEPLIQVDRRLGLAMVHPGGKASTTVFTRLMYDPVSNTSLLHCKPRTGRFHQIRVHLQFLGHPIVNDRAYDNQNLWGTNRGKGGVTTLLPELDHLLYGDPQMIIDGVSSGKLCILDGKLQYKPLTGLTQDSPVISSEVVEIIRRLESLKVQEEDWSRWRAVIQHAKEVAGLIRPPKGRPRRVQVDERLAIEPPQISVAEALEKVKAMEDVDLGGLYCPDCYLPYHPDPEVDDLYFCLHAWKYKTTLGSFEAPIPEWAEGEWTAYPSTIS